MTEEEWLDCDDPFLMLDYLKPIKGKLLGWLRPISKASERKLRLFGVACCRRGLDHIWEGCRPGIEASERFADGLAGQEALKLAGLICMSSRNGFQAARDAVEWIILGDCGPLHLIGHARYTEAHHLTPILREIIGNPFHPMALDPSRLTPTALALASGIYSERAFYRMPILADALQDAGCDNEEILKHCRQVGDHVRGCWVVDLVLGNQ